MELWRAVAVVVFVGVQVGVVVGSPQQEQDSSSRPIAKDVSSGDTREAPRFPLGPEEDLSGPEGPGHSVKEPSPLHFPPRPPKTIHALPSLPTALTNGRDLHNPSLSGAPLHFGSSGSGAAGDAGRSNTPDGGGGGGSAVNYRTRTAPACNNGSLALPCEADSEYTSEIAERVRQLLFASRLNDIIEDETVAQILNDTAVVEPGKDFGIASTRSGFVVESPACRAQESIIYPQRAKSATDDWVFVVNQDGVRQGVRVEKCLREGEQCHLGTDLPPTIRTTCRQKFIYRKLLVLGDTGTSIQPESVLLPSCCVCYIRRRGRRRRPEDHPLSKVLNEGGRRRQKTRSKTARPNRN